MNESAFTPANEADDAIDSVVSIQLSEDKMIAYLIISAPHNGGAEATLEQVMLEVKDSDVSIEVDQNAISQAIASKNYGERAIIARGVQPVNGINGIVEYHFETSGALSAKINERDEMDFKDLGLVKNIFAGTVIADITPETPGEDGMDVCGNPHKPMPGKPPNYLLGTGTILNEDKTAIIAAVDGNLKWARDNFAVDEILVIAEDVGPITGNIDFIGDVQVKGNVFEGFSVKSKKSILVNGTVNNAEIIAGGNIEVKMGCVNTTLTSKGNIKTGFCESTTIDCGGDLTSSSYVACDIFCHGTAFAITGKGVIVGGKMTCLKGMVFNTIGSESYTKTGLTLGNGAILTQEKLELEKEEAKLTEEIGKLIQKIDTINNAKKKHGTVARALEDTLATSIRARFKLSNELKLGRKRIAEIEASFLDNDNLHIDARKAIWPGVSIRIGSERKKIEIKHDRCRVEVDNSGEIAVKPITGSI
ncbi:MAG: FapA family protein [Oscillospiraceae bacterium]|nr:FapA family protein [Oscillospiraceae bacterium]